MSDKEGVHEEIIIVRRGHGDHDDHHGGAWKVAFADFMTAMMAFFLVMWLINASNEETKKAVASYFSPIKLTDRITNPKGLRTPKYGDISDVEVENEKESTVISNSKVITIKGEGVAQTFDEQALFADPYALLAEISSGLDVGAENTNPKDTAESRSSNLGLSGGDAFRDPFDPSTWKMNYENNDLEDEQTELEKQLDEQVQPSESKKIDQKTIQENSENSNIETVKDAGLKHTKKKTGVSDMENPELEKADDQEPPKLKKFDELNAKTTDMAKITDKAKTTDKAEMADTLTKTDKAEATEKFKKTAKAETTDKNESEAPETKLLQTMRKAIREIVTEEGKNAPDVQIKGDKSGTVITLFDKNKSGMFSIGSARPSPEMVRIMKKIGELLSREKGKIIVGGHTDGRKFKSKTYDNWRLSTARAHMAYHMLVRGGVAETRFEMISGFGAVKLAVPDDPFSPINRRIEISLRVS